MVVPDLAVNNVTAICKNTQVKCFCFVSFSKVMQNYATHPYSKSIFNIPNKWYGYNDNVCLFILCYYHQKKIMHLPTKDQNI